MKEHTTLPAWPRYLLVSSQPHSVRIEGPAIASGPYRDRGSALAQVVRQADRLRRPVPVTAVDPDNTTWSLLVHPDGEVEEAGPPQHTKRRRQERSRPKTNESPAPSPAAPPEATTDPIQNRPPCPVRAAIQRLATAGRLSEALRLAKQLDEAMTRQHGPSHGQTLEAREVRAHLLMLTGELGAAIALYSDAAERWALQGEQQQASTTADRAHALWLRIEDPNEALRIGTTLMRMRKQIPGEGARAYQQAYQRIDALSRRSP